MFAHRTALVSAFALALAAGAPALADEAKMQDGFDLQQNAQTGGQSAGMQTGGKTGRKAGETDMPTAAEAAKPDDGMYVHYGNKSAYGLSLGGGSAGKGDDGQQ